MSEADNKTRNDTDYGWLTPDWPAPKHVHAGTTLRNGGISQGDYAGFNLATHVGDDQQSVVVNRQSLAVQLNLSREPVWLEQVHSQVVVKAEDVQGQIPQADACYALQNQLPCVVLTADCLPLLVTDQGGSCIAAIHAGWRGLAEGIIKKTLASMPVDNKDLLVWLGPAIGPQAYEVGDDVRQAFIQQGKEAEQAFKQVDKAHWLMDIYQLARQQLKHLEVRQVFGGDYCTYTDEDRFYSYRRNKVTGRMASIIWLDK